MEQLYQKLAITDDEFDDWFLELGLLHRRMFCKCGEEMVIKKAKEGERYGTWRCNKYNCRKELSHREFFNGSHISNNIYIITIICE